MGKHKAFRYANGSTSGREIGEAPDKKHAFEAALADAERIMAGIARKAAEDSKLPPAKRKWDECHMIADDKARIIEIRRDDDGLLMYYYDVS